MSILYQPGSGSILLPTEDDMGRRRGQRNGQLYSRGGWWYVRFYEDAIDGEGNPVRPRKMKPVGPSEGRGALTRRKAQQAAWEQWLEPLYRRNLNPSSTMTVEQFVGDKFQVQVVERKKPATRRHYGYIIPSFVLPKLGHLRMCDVKRDHVEMLVADILKRRHLSVQTATHVKNAISKIWNHAIALGVYKDVNPAYKVDCGELVHEHRPTFDWERAQRAIEALPSPVRQMAELAVETSMNAAELCGLTRRHVNLTDAIREVDGEIMAPYTVAVRENWYNRQRGTLKRGKRKRNLPITREMALELARLIHDSRYQGDEYPVFCSGRGTPVNQDNIAKRVFRPLGLKLGYPVTWHAFRRAHSTFAGQVEGISLEDRQRTMGHADAAMSLYYSVEDIDRRRKIPEQIRNRLAGAAKLRIVKAEGARR